MPYNWFSPGRRSFATVAESANLRDGNNETERPLAEMQGRFLLP